jgi:hypothetical protein
MVKRYQIRLSFVIWVVAIAALALAGLPYLDWALRGFPYHDRHVVVIIDGKWVLPRS